MLRRLLLTVIIGLLAYGFWLSPDFKTLSAGVAIFLFGMLSLENGFREFTGGVLERLLQASTDRTWKSIGFGVVSTTLMQSSSLVSIITISFLSAGLLQLAAGIGIVFGANLGTTTGAWLVAGFGLKVKLSAFAMPMLVFGILLVFQKASTLRGIGYVLAGIGFLFLGIHYIKEGFEAFGSTIDLSVYQVPGIAGVLLFTLIGTVATVVMQSSHATMVLIITALATGQIGYESSLALAIGANVGTTISAILGSLGANAQGKRLAAAHLVFNLTTGILALLLLPQLVTAVEWISAVVGIAADDHALKLAVFHTVFNLLGLLLMTPLIPRMEARLQTLFIERRTAVFEPQFLSESSMEFPDTAREAVRQEVGLLYDKAVDIILAGMAVDRSLALSDASLDTLRERRTRLPRYDIDVAYGQQIKGVYSAIVSFISKVSFSWDRQQAGDLHWLRNASRHVADAVKQAKHMQKNLLVFAVSSNDAIREAYNDIRIDLVKLIREIRRIRDEEDPHLAILALDSLVMGLEDSNNRLNNRIASLLQQKQISKEMATSLLNDGGYAQDIAKDLLQAMRSLLGAGAPDAKRVQHELSLDRDEIHAVRGVEDEPVEPVS